MVSDPDGSSAPLALIAAIVVPPKLIEAAWKLGVESTAATPITPLATPGEPVRYGLGPLLPAEATTTTPAACAFCAAIESASCAVPKEEPSDMLMTSMRFFTAQSMASTTTSVEPSQPNTFSAYRSTLGATPGPTAHFLLGVLAS